MSGRRGVMLLCACVMLGLLAACGSATSGAGGFKPTIARFFLESADARGIGITLPQSGVQIGVNVQPVFTEGDVRNVELVQVDLGKCLMFEFTTSAARDLYRLSGSHQGRRLVLTLDDKPLGARRIDGAWSDGRVLVFVEVADEALPELVQRLKRSAEVVQRELAKK